MKKNGCNSDKRGRQVKNGCNRDKRVGNDEERCATGTRGLEMMKNEVQRGQEGWK